MYRVELSLHFFTVGVILRNYERFLAYGAQQRERCIQHYTGFYRAVYILIGVAYGYGACLSCHTSAHTEYRERNAYAQGYYIHRVIGDKSLAYSGARHSVQLIQTESQQQRKRYQVPMMNELYSYDATQIVFVGELTEYRSCSTAVGELKVHRIH